MATLNDIKDYKKRYIDELYFNVRSQQKIDDTYINDTFEVPEIKAPHYKYRSGLGIRIIDAPAEQITTSNPLAFFDVLSGSKEAGLNWSKVVNQVWFDILRRQNPNIFKEFNKDQLGRGEAYYKVIHNEAWLNGNKTGLPVHFIVLDPMVIYGSPEEDVNGVPERVIVSYERQLQDVIVRTSNPIIDLIPANVELSQAELDLVDAPKRELVLKEMIQGIRRSYDFILVDCLPGLGLLTINALTAADRVLIPVQADFLAMKGLVLLLSTIVKVRDRLNPSLEISGILFTMTNPRTLHSKEVIEMTKRVFGGRIKVFDTIVPISVRFKEAPVVGQSILTYAPDSEGANAYRLLTREVMK